MSSIEFVNRTMFISYIIYSLFKLIESVDFKIKNFTLNTSLNNDVHM